MTDAHRENVIFGRFTFRFAACFIFAIWVILGLIPGMVLLCLSFPKTPRTDYMGLLGTFGDSFGSINCLMASLSLLTFTYSFVQERRQSEEQANRSEDQRRQAERLSVITSLIHARTAMAEQARNS